MKQNKSKVIIITGSIGTGKSTVTNILRKMGYTVLDSDEIVHEGYNVGKDMYYDVVNYFGKDILNFDNTINRQVLGKIVFNDEKNLKKLNEIVHKTVVKELMKGIKTSTDDVLFLDIPLALEEAEHLKNNGIIYDEIWLVYVNSELQRKRLINRALIENKNPDDVLTIINKQIPIEKKISMVDEVINNEGTIEDLNFQLIDLLKRKGVHRKVRYG